MDNSALVSVNYENSRSLFNKFFLLLCMKGCAVDDETLVDHLGVGEVTYLTFYDVLTKPIRKKRVLTLDEDEEEGA